MNTKTRTTPTPAFVPCALLPKLRNPTASFSDFNTMSARTVVEEGRKRARNLMYGAGGAFRGLADRRQQIERLMRTSFASPSSSNNNGNRHNNGSNNNNNSNNGDGDEEFYVDPSWGLSPSVHVLLRRKADGAYRATVANLMSMSSVAIISSTTSTFVSDPSTPIVVILSWMGARQKHLHKYRKFYEDLGYEVHFIFNDLRTAIFPPASKAQALKVERIIDDQPEGRPVFVHAFSIGTGIYGILLDSLKNEKERLDSLTRKVVGVIFDSGPAPIFPKDVAKGLHTVFPLISKNLWEPVTHTFFWLTKARLFYGRSENALKTTQFPKVPQLYFYSGDDKVITDLKVQVEDFIDSNVQRGVEVYNKFWEKSIHASHLKVHPDEYLANLSTFVHRCMEVRNQQKTIPHN